MAKQSDHIENRFREAAENLTVPPNPVAWQKMEQMLDDENRRKPVVFWWYLLVLFVVGGAAFFTYQATKKPANVSQVKDAPGNSIANKIPGNSVKTSAGKDSGNTSAHHPAKTSMLTGQEVENDVTVKPAAQAAVPADNSVNKAVTDEAQVKPAGKTDLNTLPSTANRNDLRLQQSLNRLRKTKSGDRLVARSARLNSAAGKFQKATGKSQSASRSKQGENVRSEAAGQREITRTAKDSSSSEIITAGNEASGSGAILKDSSLAKSGTASVATVKSTGRAPVSKDSSITTQIKLKAANGKWKLNRGLNFSVAGKLDATGLHHISLHEFNTIFGIGLGYRFSNRFSVQTGAFVQRAVYFAGPEDYTVKPGSYLSYYRISKIDANCLFYEIPLNLRYDFLIGKSLRIYSTAGFNSYIMRKESYRYHAMGSTGYRMFDSTYTSNRNIFASASFSAGIEKKLTPSFSVQLEPYITLPNSGLGEGKIKLYSSGAQLSLKFQPARSKLSGKK